jgi:hypothetical protein
MKNQPAKQAAHTYTTTTATQDINMTLESALTFPEEPIGGRLILEPLDLMDIEAVPTTIIGGTTNFRRKGSHILLTEEQVKQIRDEFRANIQPAVVMAVGQGCSPWLLNSIHPGDTVRVYLNQCEASVEVDGKSYVIYPERCIISKMK